MELSIVIPDFEPNISLLELRVVDFNVSFLNCFRKRENWFLFTPVRFPSIKFTIHSEKSDELFRTM